MGGGGDFDELDAASESRHGGKHDDAGFKNFSVADKFQAHSYEVKPQQDEEPPSDLSGFEHIYDFQLGVMPG